jgi:anthranilate synthase component 2
MEPILVIDNYDSFVHNLVHYLEKAGADVDVYRNDRISTERALQWQRILLSPGPGLPGEAGVMAELIERAAGERDILGVCLGHQAIGEVHGARLSNLEGVIHGKSTRAELETDSYLFQDIPERFEIGHYHSWVLDEASLGEDFLVTVRDEDGSVMGIEHRELPLAGVQFHPESVLTPNGYRIIENWLHRKST